MRLSARTKYFCKPKVPSNCVIHACHINIYTCHGRQGDMMIFVSVNQWMFLTAQRFLMRFWRAEPDKQPRTLDVSKAGVEKMKKGHRHEESCFMSMFCPLEGHFYDVLFTIQASERAPVPHDDLNPSVFCAWTQPDQEHSVVTTQHGN